MKILALALADESQRFIRGYPPRGAWSFLRPNLEIRRLTELVAGTDQLVYRDERVELLRRDGDETLGLVYVDFDQEHTARETVARLEESGLPCVLFGPQVTAWQDTAPGWAAHRVHGDVLNAWPELRADALSGKLIPVYRASRRPGYFPMPGCSPFRPGMNTRYQVTSFVRGCSCPPETRQFCPEFLYYDDSRYTRPKDEIVGETISMPHKHIHLLDEDIARDPDYYEDLFRILWNYRRHWTVHAGDRLFRHPRFIRLLAKAGTRVVFLNETFLRNRLKEAVNNDRLVKLLYRRVKFLQSRKMLVGAKIAITLLPDRCLDFPGIARVLRRLDLDFIELRFLVLDEDGTTRLLRASYQPMLSPTEPAWIKHRFYSMGAILDRLARRPRRVGFYTTTRYLLPLSMSYRQNFLEGIPFP